MKTKQFAIFGKDLERNKIWDIEGCLLPIEPKPLINKEGFDVFPFFSPDGKDMYFVRDFCGILPYPVSRGLEIGEVMLKAADKWGQE